MSQIETGHLAAGDRLRKGRNLFAAWPETHGDPLLEPLMQEKIMVCVSSGPVSAQLIRSAKRLADGLNAELFAVHVEIPRRRCAHEQDRIARNMRLAEELGAQTYTIIGDDFVKEIIDTARAKNVSTIVVGKPDHGRFKDIMKRSAVDRMIRESGGISIHIIRGNTETEQQHVIKTAQPIAGSNWRHYAAGLAMVAAVTAFSILIENHMEQINIPLLYQLPVIMAAYWWGRWPSYFTAICAVGFFDFFFIPPVLAFTIDEIRYFWNFIIFLLVAFIIGGRTERLRTEAATARQREQRTRALYDFSREIAAVIDPCLIAKVLAKHAAETIGRAIAVLMPDTGGKLATCVQQNPGNDAKVFETDPLDLPAALWAFEHGRPAGRSTETSTGINWLFVPLKTPENTAGVLCVHQVNPYVSPEDKRLIEAWVGLASIALERIEYAKKAREAALLAEADKLRTALFNSLSHELKAPLASIVASITTLLGTGGVYSEKARQDLLETIGLGASQMERLISNLLDTARLESGMIQLKIDWCDMADIIGTALNRLGDSIARYSVAEEIEPDLPLLKADCVLLEQVMVNLLDNAMKYSACNSKITVKAQTDGAGILVSVSDRGIGIPPDDINKIFNKFFRVQQPKRVSGTGLGLSICKGIIEAHGGKIWAGNRKGGGSIISFHLPASENLAIRPGKAELSHE